MAYDNSTTPTNEDLLQAALSAHKGYMREESASVGHNQSAASFYQGLMNDARAVLRDRGYEIDFFTDGGKLLPIHPPQASVAI